MLLSNPCRYTNKSDTGLGSLAPGPAHLLRGRLSSSCNRQSLTVPAGGTAEAAPHHPGFLALAPAGLLGAGEALGCRYVHAGDSWRSKRRSAGWTGGWSTREWFRDDDLQGVPAVRACTFEVGSMAAGHRQVCRRRRES